MNTQGAHRYEDRLLEFAYGELPAAEARSIEVHVKGCARCTGALRDIEGVRRQMSQLAPEPAPDAGLDSLLAYAEQAARRAAAGPSPSRGWRRWVFGAVGAASLAAVLVVVGVVANRPELKPASPATIRMEEAKSQAQLQDQSVAAAPPPAVAAPAAAGGAPPADPTPAAQPVAEEKNKEGDALAKDAPAEEAPPPEPKVGRAVGKGNGYEVQKVDVNSDLDSARKTVEKKPLDARYRETGTDRADAMQNMVAGKRTPVLPTTGTQGYAQKTAEAADGEMVFPDTKPSGHAAAAPAPAKPAPSTSYRKSTSFQKTAPAPTASKKKSARSSDDFGGALGGLGEGRVASKSSAGPSPYGGSKGGAKDDSDALALGSNGLGRTRGGGTTDDSGRFGLGSGSTSGAGGTARPSAPTPQAAPPAPAPALAARAQQQEAEVQAKQRAASQAEASRRDEMRKLEQEKVQRDVAPSTAPAMEAPASAAPSTRGAPQRVAMNEPPPPPPAANSKSEAEDEEVAAQDPAQRASIPLSSAGASSSRKSADAPQPSKVRTVNAQELFLAATKARPGSPEEINGLIIAINAGLGGQYRIDALQRLCVRLDAANDSRAYDYCSAWSSADPSSALAMKRAQSTEERWGPRSKAKAAKKASEPAKADTRAPAAVSY